MLELCPQEMVCPNCKRTFYPHMRSKRKIFCGEDTLCSPPGDNFMGPDCRFYDFCSEECLAEFEQKTETCPTVPRWKRLMEKIYNVSHAQGMAGVRCHELPKENK